MSNRSITETSRDWRTIQAKGFAVLCCECGREFSDSSSGLYRAYLAWTRAMFCQPMTQELFSRSLRALGFHFAKASSMKVLGIRHVPSRTSSPQSNEHVATFEERLREVTRERPSVRQVEAFLADRCEVDAMNEELASDLYDAYAHWADSSGRMCMSGTAFGRALRDLGFRPRKSNLRHWSGLRLRPTNAPAAAVRPKRGS